MSLYLKIDTQLYHMKNQEQKKLQYMQKFGQEKHNRKERTARNKKLFLWFLDDKMLISGIAWI